jgi:transcriptional regulator with XRE-family HTH domain
MAEVQRPTLRSRRLGMELRKMREALGYSTHAAGRLLNRTQSSLSKLETGHRGIRIPALLQILDAYGIKDPKRRDDLIRLAKEARKTGWWHAYDGTLSPDDIDLIGLEAEAIAISYFEVILIPGLFQTEEYVRALTQQGAYAGDSELIERLVAVRMRRQTILGKADPPDVRAVIDEAALWRLVGGPATMRRQLRRLVDLSGLPHVTLQVLPFSGGAYREMASHFHAIETPDLQAVTVDGLTGMSYLESAEEIMAHSEAFGRLTRVALPEQESRALIRRLASGI